MAVCCQAPSLSPLGASGLKEKVQPCDHPPAHAQGGGPAAGQGDPTRPPGPQGDSGFPLWLSPQTQSRRPQATGPVLPGPAQQRFSLGGQRKWRETSWAQSKGTDNISSAGSECRVRVETEAGPQGLEVGSELLGEPDLGFPRRFPLSGYLNHFEKVIRSLLSHPSFLCGQQQPGPLDAWAAVVGWHGASINPSPSTPPRYAQLPGAV